MTKSAFLILCNKYLIDPGVALENPAVVAALQAKDDVEVERILREEF